MNPLEIKKQIIKEIITPFFKNNGFTKKGVKYLKVINHLTIEAWIQTLRYYKNENTDEFRITMKIYPDFEPFGFMSFGGYSIPRESSHITIDENTEIDELKTSLKNELNSFLNFLEKYNDVERIIKEQQLEIKKIEKSIIERKHELEKETKNKNLINILENAIKLCEKNIDVKNNWIKIVMGL